nr:dihydrodipicolinate synthase family protein [Candidatus Sigynarchaeota archaeon]
MVPLVTWLEPNGNVDLNAIGMHIDSLLKTGFINGIFVLGSTGEGAYRTFEEKKAIMHYAVDHVKKRAPVLAGISAFGPREAIQLGETAIKEGIDGVFVIVPQYFDLKASDVEFYFKKLAAGLKGEIPILMYYAPRIVTNHPKIEPAMIFKLAKEKIISGIKDTVFEWEHVAEIKRLLKTDYTVQCNIWVGTDKALIDCLKQCITDFDGVIASGLNMFPDFYNVLVKAFRDSPRNEARCTALEKISDLVRELFSMELRELPALVKAALSNAKLPYAKCADVSPPLPRLRPEIHENMTKILVELRKKGISLL